MTRPYEKIAAALVVVYAAWTAAVLVRQPQLYQWDFYGYYWCAKAFLAGINPYDTNAVARMAGAAVLPYVYPPLTLSVFLPFAIFDYLTAYYIYLFLKLIALAGLVCLWRNVFLNRQGGAFFYILCLFAFNAAMFTDMRSGNLALFEQCGLWVAFWMFLRRKYSLFAAAIVITALFKMQPVIFLGLLLLEPGDGRRRIFAVSCAAFCGILAAQYLVSPSMFGGFAAHAVNTVEETGIINPSSYALTRELLRLHGVHIWGYGAIVTAVAVISWKASRRLYQAAADDSAMRLIGIACCMYALCSVRFKDYSYMILIVPACFAFMRCAGISRRALFAVLASLSAMNIALPGLGVVAYFWWNYYPLVTAFIVWLTYVLTHPTSDPAA